MILLADANILIDLGYVHALDILARVGKCEILSTVLIECEDTRQEDLIQQIKIANITIIEVEKQLINDAIRYPNKRLSSQDKQCLIYCQQQQRTLLTGDKILREEAKGAGVDVHGTIWLVDQALSSDTHSHHEICRWLQQWKKIGRRLPSDELKRLRATLGCSS